MRVLGTHFAGRFSFEKLLDEGHITRERHQIAISLHTLNPCAESKHVDEGNERELGPGS
jgi:hypothetical protein